jgi:hypothetical protein
MCIRRLCFLGLFILIGQVPLEVLNFVVDSRAQKLIPNPAHGGEQMSEEYFQR